jgi:hypothetical protein
MGAKACRMQALDQCPPGLGVDGGGRALGMEVGKTQVAANQVLDRLQPARAQSAPGQDQAQGGPQAAARKQEGERKKHEQAREQGQQQGVG